jgi:hypothetical protein
MSIRLRAVVWFAAVGAWGCDGDSPAPGGAYGESCSSVEPCASDLFCQDFPGSGRNMCSNGCDPTIDCGEGYLCFDFVDAGFSACIRRCTSGSSSPMTWAGRTYACIDGVPTDCASLAYGVACGACGCRDGEYCTTVDDPGCHPRRPVGEACTYDYECQSRNCDHPSTSETLVCMVAVGSACSSTDCGYCLGSGSFCSRYCSSASSTSYTCPSEYHCAGSEGTYHCVADCTTGYCEDGYGCSSNPSECPANTECRRVTETDYETWLEVTACYACF